MSIMPFRGRCHTCGHDHDIPVFRIDPFKQLAEQAELAKLKRQRDDLLAAAKAVHNLYERMKVEVSIPMEECKPVYSSLETAIAAAEGDK